ncbi:MAG: hypothetical protein K0R00_2565 [Herbinix sp.]|nr:hypothetical protein [Herbinix sp.]
MDKEKENSSFDIENDPDFNENFYKNIERALGDHVNLKEEAKQNEIEENSNNVIESNPKIDEEKVPIDKSSAMEEEIKESTDKESTASSTETSLVSEEDIEDELIGINSSLAKQISDELSTIDAEKNTKKKKILLKIQSGVVLSLLCIIGFAFLLGFTKPGNWLLMSMGVNLSGTLWAAWTGNFDDGTDVVEDVDYLDEDDLTSEGEEIDVSTIVWPNHLGEGRKEEGVYNVLLLGEEAIGSGSGRGRTDVIVIATMNTNNKTIKLTSLMRDSFVQIPGYNDNKLNTAYEKGGLDLLYQTIALNYDLHLDGCVLVNFEKFEEIIDKLGGLEITLTAGEAKYLNTTNYISNPAYRNVKEGTQLLNGNQVLGYSRVRKRATITGNNNDYGRTDRHRIVLNAIFDKYKTESKTKLASMILELLPMIKTDIDSKGFQMLLNTFIEMGTTDMSQLRVPVDGAFNDQMKVRGMSVLILEWDTNIEALHSFIFGDDTTQSVVPDHTEDGETTTN